MYIILNKLVLIASIIIVTACNSSGGDQQNQPSSSSSSSSSTSSGSADTPVSSIEISGLDSSKFGETLVLPYLAYREDSLGWSKVLVASTSRFLTNEAADNLDELEVDVGLIDNWPFDYVRILVAPYLVRLYFSVDGQSWYYNTRCVDNNDDAVNCEGISYNSDGKTVTFSDVELSLYESTSTDPPHTVSLSGALVWTDTEEIVGSHPAPDIAPPTVGEPATMEDLQGIVWSRSYTSAANNVKYGRYVDNKYYLYDYMGDSYNNGENCYVTQQGGIEDLGGGLFEVTLPVNRKYKMYYYKNESQIIVGDFGVWSPSEFSVSDFVPLCET